MVSMHMLPCCTDPNAMSCLSGTLPKTISHVEDIVKTDSRKANVKITVETRNRRKNFIHSLEFWINILKVPLERFALKLFLQFQSLSYAARARKSTRGVTFVANYLFSQRQRHSICIRGWFSMETATFRCEAIGTSTYFPYGTFLAEGTAA